MAGHCRGDSMRSATCSWRGHVDPLLRGILGVLDCILGTYPGGDTSFGFEICSGWEVGREKSTLSPMNAHDQSQVTCGLQMPWRMREGDTPSSSFRQEEASQGDEENGPAVRQNQPGPCPPLTASSMTYSPRSQANHFTLLCVHSKSRDKRTLFWETDVKIMRGSTIKSIVQ